MIKKEKRNVSKCAIVIQKLQIAVSNSQSRLFYSAMHKMVQKTRVVPALLFKFAVHILNVTYFHIHSSITIHCRLFSKTYGARYIQYDAKWIIFQFFFFLFWYRVILPDAWIAQPIYKKYDLYRYTYISILV